MEKKIFKLPQSAEVTNYLSRPISRLERVVIEPCHSIARGVKSACRAFMGFVKWFFLISGVVAWAASLYFGSMYYRGYAELMLVSNDEVQRYSKVLEPKKAK
jgi:hypothetical protein